MATRNNQIHTHSKWLKWINTPFSHFVRWIPQCQTRMSMSNVHPWIYICERIVRVVSADWIRRVHTIRSPKTSELKCSKCDMLSAVYTYSFRVYNRTVGYANGSWMRYGPNRNPEYIKICIWLCVRCHNVYFHVSYVCFSHPPSTINITFPDPVVDHAPTGLQPSFTLIRISSTACI